MDYVRVTNPELMEPVSVFTQGVAGAHICVMFFFRMSRSSGKKRVIKKMCVKVFLFLFIHFFVLF